MEGNIYSTSQSKRQNIKLNKIFQRRISLLKITWYTIIIFNHASCILLFPGQENANTGINHMNKHLIIKCIAKLTSKTKNKK